MKKVFLLAFVCLLPVLASAQRSNLRCGRNVPTDVCFAVYDYDGTKILTVGAFGGTLWKGTWSTNSPLDLVTPMQTLPPSPVGQCSFGANGTTGAPALAFSCNASAPQNLGIGFAQSSLIEAYRSTASLGANTTAFQLIDGSGVTINAGALNDITAGFQKALHIEGWTALNAVNNTETLKLGLCANGGVTVCTPFQFIKPIVAGLNYLRLSADCVTTTTGAAGRIECWGEQVVYDPTGNTFNQALDIEALTPLDLTAALTLNWAIAFGTASVTNHVDARILKMTKEN